MAKPTGESFEAIKLTKTIRKAFWDAQEAYDLIVPGDKIVVCLSGGKDSYTLLDLMLQAQMVRGYDFEILAVNLDQKQPGFPKHILPDYLSS